MIVKKIGGSCLVDDESTYAIAKHMAAHQSDGEQSVLVVSAMQGVTNELEKVYKKQINNANTLPHQSQHEYNCIVSTGEQLSAALLSIAMKSLGLSSRVYTAYDLGFVCVDSEGGHYQLMRKGQLLQDIAAGVIPVITGFQVLDQQGRLSTLGRNGSDLSAVVLAHLIRATECRLYKDVPGVFTHDPKHKVTSDRYHCINVHDPLLRYMSNIMYDRAIHYLQKHFTPVKIMNLFFPHLGTEISLNEPTCLAYDGTDSQKPCVIHSL